MQLLPANSLCTRTKTSQQTIKLLWEQQKLSKNHRINPVSHYHQNTHTHKYTPYASDRNINFSKKCKSSAPFVRNEPRPTHRKSARYSFIWSGKVLNLHKNTAFMAPSSTRQRPDEKKLFWQVNMNTYTSETILKLE